ncbi:MAG: hypothetical protein M1816_002213 [Peltula sp. TS41687]|nr:MAG: hypothetical protein M1816_002213 [Peltula sp. TS41687]
MELDLLPATVYQPPRSGPVPSKVLHITIEEWNDGEKDRETGRSARNGSSAGHAGALRAPSPPIRSPSPSSSVDSVRLSWTSSETGSTVDSTTDFEDLYDPVDVHLGKDEEFIPVMLVDQPGCDPTPTFQRRIPACVTGVKSKYPFITIPAAQYLPGERDHDHGLPIPPTPPPKVPFSPAVLSLLTRNIPAVSSPPSLDESLTSDRLVHSDAPPTPLETDAIPERWDGGVQLNPQALATLQMLSNDQSEETPDSSIETPPGLVETEQLDPSFRRHTLQLQTPCSGPSFPSLAQLEIPSPTGFFASLAPGTRRTWCPSAFPPSSTTAERFYQCPWNRPVERTIEQVIEVRDTDTNGPSTAQLITPRPLACEEYVREEFTGTDDTGDDGVQEIVARPSPTLSATLDRTALWLSRQMEYLTSVGEFPTVDEESGEDLSAIPAFAIHRTRIEELTSTAKDGGLWNVFLSLLRMSTAMDVFVHSRPRFDAIQTRRICAPAAHRRQLLNLFQGEAGDQRLDTPKADLVSASRAGRDRSTLQEISATHWNIMAMRYLNGGKLLTSPASNLLTGKSSTVSGRPFDCARILDLGGQPTCDWAWHCADEYPTSQVYTVVPVGSRQPSSSHTSGPQNHSQVSVSRLWKLPFPDDHFEVISARNLYTILKADKASGDEYDLCLEECRRCLKPGGYLEFSLLDAELVQAGPLGTAMSVEFAFNLKTRGYDSSPTRAWLGRLKKAGFADVKRAWTFMPMGVPNNTVPENGELQRDEPLEVKCPVACGGLNTESTVEGGTEAIAAVSGLVGLRAWETWMLKLQMEAGKKEESLLEGVSAVVQEGRNHGTGWRCLNGWARKS